MHKYNSLQEGQLPQENLSFLQNLQNFIITKYLKQEVDDNPSVCMDERSPCGFSIISTTTQSDTNPPTSSPFMKTPAAKLPQLTGELTRSQFHKFKTDRDVYKRVLKIMLGQGSLTMVKAFVTVEMLCQTVTMTATA